MRIRKVYAVYFSATFTTRAVVRRLSAAFGVEVEEYDVFSHPLTHDVTLSEGDLLVAGMPVYIGRIPERGAESLRHFKGNGQPAVVAAVYGNRHYDDAVIEMKDIVEAGGFTTVAAGAFVAQHSMLPRLAAGRPNAADLDEIDAFGRKVRALLETASELKAVEVPGNRPYRETHPIALCPEAGEECAECGVCVENCPVDAIPADNPRLTDASRCLRCGRCIAVCTQGARGYRGEMYAAFEAKFLAAFSEPRPNETWIAE